MTVLLQIDIGSQSDDILCYVLYVNTRGELRKQGTYRRRGARLRRHHLQALPHRLQNLSLLADGVL